ncbi:hypothetical protein B4143_2634 [Bacillus subtilis]|nr:hypothetical protein B4143_2634 [Bacillus subtilis]CCU59117.1 hypothetical protein BSUBE1_2486 [Bacillus subtilis E1]
MKIALYFTRKRLKFLINKMKKLGWTFIGFFVTIFYHN